MSLSSSTLFRRAGAVCLMALLGAVSIGAARPAPAPDAHRMSEHIRVLSSDAFEGRGPGTAGETKATGYIISQFKALGLKPGGENGGWTQAVTLNRFTTQPGVTISVTAGGVSTFLVFGEQSVVQTRKPGVDQVAVKDAPLVFVGYGVNAPQLGWDDFKGVDLKGRSPWCWSMIRTSPRPSRVCSAASP